MPVSAGVKVGSIRLGSKEDSRRMCTYVKDDKEAYVTKIARISVGEAEPKSPKSSDKKSGERYINKP